MIKRSSLLLFLLINTICIVSAQRQIKIFGYLFDEKRTPIESANIIKVGSDIGTTSTSSGYFEMMVSSADTTDLLFSYLGYEKCARSFPPSQQDYFINITMEPISEELGGVTITESRRQTGSMQRVDVNKMRYLPDASGGSIESLIVTFAGVNSNNELSSQYSVRGGNFDENSVYINGIEVYRPILIRAGQQEGLSIINPDMVGEVEFSAGGYDAKYGDKMASVLDISYKRPTSFEAAISGSLLGASGYIGHSKGNFTQMHGVRFKKNTTLLSSLQEKGEYDPSYLDYQTYLTWSPSSKWDMTFLGNISNNEYNFTPQERSTQFGNYANAKKFKVYFDGKEEDLFQTIMGAYTLNYKLDDNTKLGLNFSTFATSEKETYDIKGEYWLSEVDGLGGEGETSGIGTYHEHARNYLKARVINVGHSGESKLGSHQINWGASYQQERIMDRMREWEMRDSAGYSVPSTGDKVNVYYNLRSKNDLSSNRYQAYVQDHYRWVNRSGLWSATAGVRFAYWSYNSEFIASPRASISFIPHSKPDFTFRFATGVYHQSPFYKEFRDTVNVDGNVSVRLNDKIKSQRSLQFIAGGDLNFRWDSRPFRFTTEVYYKAMDRLIPYSVDNVRIRYYGDNLANGYSTGVDFKLFGEFVPGTDSWVSFSLMSSKEKINGVWVPRPTDQRYSFSLFYQDYFPGNPKYKFSMKAILADGTPVSAPHAGRENGYFRTPSYKRIDCGVSRQLVGTSDKIMRSGFFEHFKSIWIALDLFNIINFKNVNSYYWVSDVHGNQYAVPNYLTSFQINLRLSAEF
ncbi:MAG: TonB-dependent receptor [Bacteroidales bacterium]